MRVLSPEVTTKLVSNPTLGGQFACLKPGTCRYMDRRCKIVNILPAPQSRWAHFVVNSMLPCAHAALQGPAQ